MAGRGGALCLNGAPVATILHALPKLLQRGTRVRLWACGQWWRMRVHGWSHAVIATGYLLLRRSGAPLQLYERGDYHYVPRMVCLTYAETLASIRLGW